MRLDLMFIDQLEKGNTSLKQTGILQYANYDEYHFDSQKTYESGCRIEGLPCTLEDKINTINPFLMIIGGLLSELPDELTLK